MTQQPNADPSPALSPGTGLYRTVFTVVVLSNKPVADNTVLEVAQMFELSEVEGDATVTSARQVSKREMALALREADTEPEHSVLDRDNDLWKYDLGTGDEVTWNEPDGQPRELKLLNVEYVDDQVVKLWTTNGYIEARVDDLA